MPTIKHADLLGFLQMVQAGFVSRLDVSQWTVNKQDTHCLIAGIGCKMDTKHLPLDFLAISPHFSRMTVLFTKENAGEMARRAALAREAKKKALLKRLEDLPEDASEDARHKRVLMQIQRCDQLLATCFAKDFAALTAAKERLWKLIYPTAGVLRPKRASDRPARPTMAPITPQAGPTNGDQVAG